VGSSNAEINLTNSEFSLGFKITEALYERMGTLEEELSIKGSELRASHGEAKIDRAIAYLEQKDTDFAEISANTLIEMLN
jgi:hypothetical protein